MVLVDQGTVKTKLDGIYFSEQLKQTAQVADRICVVRSMTSKFSEHAQANFFMHTGFPFMGYPSAGAWMSYGLGTESENLPGYVVLRAGVFSVATAGLASIGAYTAGLLILRAGVPALVAVFGGALTGLIAALILSVPRVARPIGRAFFSSKRIA